MEDFSYRSRNISGLYIYGSHTPILGSCPLANCCYFAFGKDFDFDPSIPSFQRINVSKYKYSNTKQLIGVLSFLLLF